MTDRSPAAGTTGAGAPARATCGGCGLVCDDISATVVSDRVLRPARTCALGDAWFAGRTGASPPPAAIGGLPVPLDDALDTAATLLARGRSPLIYGLGRSTCEAQRAAIGLAESLGAIIDSAGGALDGAFGHAAQARGSVTASLGDVRDRAGAVLAWRVDPVRDAPRLLPRLGLDRAGRATAGSDPGRLLIVVDEEHTATAAHADIFVRLPREHDVAALWTLRALATGVEFDRDRAAALPLGELERLMFHLRGHNGVAVLYGAPAVGPRPSTIEAHALLALVHDLNAFAHAVGVWVRADANAAGAEEVLTSRTGFPAAVSFARGRPRANPAEFTAADVLERGDADVVLVLGSDPIVHLPPAATAALIARPTVVVDSVATATTRSAAIVLTPAAAGVHAAGTVQRMDGVPLPLRAPLPRDRPGETRILEMLRERIVAQRTAPREP